MNYKIILPVFLILSSISSVAQISSDIKDHFSDSIVSSYLVKLYPSLDENVLGNGRNYRYLSFRLPIENKSDTIEILNFGENSTHRPSLMLVLIVSGNSSSKQLLLGLESLELDLASIKNFFLLYPGVKKRYKLEILDIWLQSRKGVIKTDCYIH
ncbi:hypothetical protein ACX0G9_26925 [Flavitalea flava]